MYQVYVIENPKGAYYVGLSADIERRLVEHNSGISKWTRGKGPWKLSWKSELLTLSEARKLENKLKRQGRGTGFFTLTGLPRRGS